MLAVMALALVPDLDLGIVWLFGGSPQVFHRTFSHSLFFLPVLGALLALHTGRRGAEPFWPWFTAYTGVLLSHPLLDYLTGAPLQDGVALFSPFLGQRFSFPWPLLPRVGGANGFSELVGRDFPLVLAATWREIVIFFPVAVLCSLLRNALDRLRSAGFFSMIPGEVIEEEPTKISSSRRKTSSDSDP